MKKRILIISGPCLITYGIVPVAVDPEDSDGMKRMAEFICRVNYGLQYGCFEFDFRDGWIRFKSFIDCEKHAPSLEAVKNSIQCTAAMFKCYGPGIIDIIFGGVSAKEAIIKCEKSEEGEE